METKSLNFEQMENIDGGGRKETIIGGAFGVVSMAAGVALCATGVGSPLGASLLATSISTSVVSGGMGLAGLMGAYE